MNQNTEILSEAAAGRMLDLSVRTLQRMRLTGTGPAFVQLTDRRIGYMRADIDAWIAARRRTSTSQMTGKAA